MFAVPRGTPVRDRISLMISVLSARRSRFVRKNVHWVSPRRRTDGSSMKL